MSKTKNFVTILIDGSGSMCGQEHRVVSGVNEYLAKLAGDTHSRYRVSISVFDSERYDSLRANDKIGECKPLEPGEYVTGAATPLFDSIGRCAADAEKRADGRRVLCIIDTDGFENASQEFTQDKIRALIKSKQDAGWTFVFLGADMDAFAAGNAMGLDIGTMNASSISNAGRKAAYANLANATTTYASSSTGSVRNFHSQ